jgi:hypothetical protein
MVRIYSPEQQEAGLMVGMSSLVTYYQPAAARCGPESCGSADLYLGAEEYAGKDHEVRSYCQEKRGQMLM